MQYVCISSCRFLSLLFSLANGKVVYRVDFPNESGDREQVNDSKKGVHFSLM